jgi:outer membrane protein assembly factor BamD (BamD/ComL family)
LKNVPYILAALIVGVLIISCSSSSQKQKTEQELYTQAQDFSEKGDFQSAIKTYQELLKLYPESARAYKAQFLIAFVYSENLKNKEKAKENYQIMLDKYPNCDLTDDARYMLQSMENDSLPPIPDVSSPPTN